jgi:gluconolactonase
LGSSKVETMRQPEVVATGLGHPEGPCPLPDGRIVLANTYASELAIWEAGVGTSTLAYTGGGPNGCALGSDGYVYVTQTPNVGTWKARDQRPPSIQRVSMGGVVEIVATEIEGVAFDGPNDLTFGADGRLYFTDSGDWDPESRPHPGRIFALAAHGGGEIVEHLDHVYPNGIVAEADGSLVWGESYTRQIWRRRPDGARKLLRTLDDGHIPDGMKLDAEGNIWIATVTSGGIDVITSDGEYKTFVETGGYPLNLAFSGPSIFVADMGLFDTSSADVPMAGNLLRMSVEATGKPQFTGSVGIRRAAGVGGADDAG